MAVNNIEEAELVLPYLARGEFCRLCARQEMYFTSLGHFGSTIKRFLDDDDIVGVEVEPIPKGVLSEDGTWHSICNMSYDSQFVKLSDDEGYLRILRKVEKPVPQWTSVKDGLPETSEDEYGIQRSRMVQVCVRETLTGHKYLSDDMLYNGDWAEYPAKVDEDEDGGPAIFQITHWMPQPELPKDGDD